MGMGKVRYVYPQACPHCGKSIDYLKPVGDRTLQAALLVLRGASTAPEVGALLKIPLTQASDLLRRAQGAKLVKLLRVVPRESGKGGPVHYYGVTQRMAAYAPLEYRLMQRRVS